jgi:hypothetical protein
MGAQSAFHGVMIGDGNNGKTGSGGGFDNKAGAVKPIGEVGV